jgi:uncharacterized membrane protein required for colicin V production
MAISLKSVLNNDKLTNFIIFITIALSVGYFVNKNYNALVLLYVLGILMYLLCKNVICSLGISIILTNIFLSLNMVNVTENLENKKKKPMGILKRKMMQNE